MKVSETKSESYVNRKKERTNSATEKENSERDNQKTDQNEPISSRTKKTVSAPSKHSKCFLTLLQVLTILIRKFKRVKNV